jgi:hypothetical protein
MKRSNPELMCGSVTWMADQAGFSDRPPMGHLDADQVT